MTDAEWRENVLRILRELQRSVALLSLAVLCVQLVIVVFIILSLARGK